MPDIRHLHDNTPRRRRLPAPRAPVPRPSPGFRFAASGLRVLIAGQALSRDLTLITHNTREFAGVRGLRFEDWE
jgi:hypothetical protein